MSTAAETIIKDKAAIKKLHDLIDEINPVLLECAQNRLIVELVFHRTDLMPNSIPRFIVTARVTKFLEQF